MSNNLPRIALVHGSKFVCFSFKSASNDVSIFQSRWISCFGRICTFCVAFQLHCGNLPGSTLPFLYIESVIKLKMYHLALALAGNAVLWKLSPAATYSNYLVHQIFTQAGVPPGVIQFVPGPPPEVVARAINHPSFAALHFTGSTFVFKKLWKDIAMNLDNESWQVLRLPQDCGWDEWKEFFMLITGLRRFEMRWYRAWGARLSTKVDFFFSSPECLLLHLEGRGTLLISLMMTRPEKFCTFASLCFFVRLERRDQFLAEIEVGSYNDRGNFMGPVMYAILVLVLWFYNLWIKIDNNNNRGRPSFDMIISYVKKVEILVRSLLEDQVYSCIISLCSIADCLASI